MGAPAYIGLLHGFHVWLDTEAAESQPFMVYPEGCPDDYVWLYGQDCSGDMKALAVPTPCVPQELFNHLKSIRQLL